MKVLIRICFCPERILPQYFGPGLSYGCKKDMTTSVMLLQCYVFLSFIFSPVIAFEAHSLSPYPLNSLNLLGFGKPQMKTSRQIGCHSLHNSTFWYNYKGNCTFSSSKEGSDSVLPLHSNTSDNKRKTNLLCAFAVLGSFGRVHAWQPPFKEHGRPSKTNGLSSNKYQRVGCMDLLQVIFWRAQVRGQSFLVLK